MPAWKQAPPGWQVVGGRHNNRSRQCGRAIGAITSPARAEGRKAAGLSQQRLCCSKLHTGDQLVFNKPVNKAFNDLRVKLFAIVL